jgi:hypothetical protein
MRVLIAVAAVLSASLATAPPTGANQQKKTHKQDTSATRAQKSDDYYAKRAREHTQDCVRAQSLDPAGDYKSYPCWARAALAPGVITGK